MRKRPDDGAVSTEYAILVVFIAMVVVFAIAGLGAAVDGLFDQGASAIP